MMRLRALVVLCVAIAARVDAQCPDGTPRPCRAARRPNPPADPRTWIVLPFHNLTRATDIDWLRDASVNLLYMDLSRWRDIRVVDDERVADLLREVPEARGARPLSLNTALAIARRAGAGQLVMGDLLKTGTRTTIVAKLFDARSGRRVRSVREEVSSADSLIAAFGRLARAILNVAPPAGARVGDIGTSHVDAYQEYLAGVRAFNAVQVVEARRRFERATQLDSTFALAEYKLAIVLLWESGRDLASVRLHADRASRLAGDLPPRERVLVESMRRFANEDYAGACEGYRRLVAADSADVDAQYGLGECLWHDEQVEPSNPDSTGWRFRSSWNEAIGAFTRVLELDPTYHIAFQRILDAVTSLGRPGCRRHDPAIACEIGRGLGNRLGGGPRVAYRVFESTLRRDGDTLLTVPEYAFTTGTGGRGMMAPRQPAPESMRESNLDDARRIAERWVAAGPTEFRARAMLGHVYLLLGRLQPAEQQLALVRGDLTTMESISLLTDRLEVNLRLYQTADFVRRLDSATALWRGGLPIEGELLVARMRAVTGRMSAWDSLSLIRGLPPREPADLKAPYEHYFRQAGRVVLGVMTDSAVEAERQLFDAIRAVPSAIQRSPAAIAPTLLFGLRLPRTSWPPVVAEPGSRRFDAAAALAGGDTAALLVASRTLAARPATAANIEELVTALDAALIVRDTSGALAVARRLVDTTLVGARVHTLIGTGLGVTAFVWPRAMLQRADLAAALGYRGEARVWYRRFLDLWAKADPELQPLVTRARKSMTVCCR